MALTINRRKDWDGRHRTTNPGIIDIALLNNMPDGAIRSSEQQFAKLLAAASGDLDLRLSLYEMPQLERNPGAREELMRDYRPADDLLTEGADGLIVTGCEPKAATLPEETYWKQLTEVIDWAESRTISSIWSCLAAHAAVLHRSGIGRIPFETKLSGVFHCRKARNHALVRDLPEFWSVPHSRQYGLATADLKAGGYHALTESETAGVDIFIRQDRSLFVLFQGHLEYESDSLLREYIRDITRYLDREREFYPEMPHNLFSGTVRDEFLKLREAAMNYRSRELVSRIPVREAQAQLMNGWWNHAVSVYRQWLQLIAEVKAAGRHGGSVSPVRPMA